MNSKCVSVFLWLILSSNIVFGASVGTLLGFAEDESSVRLSGVSITLHGATGERTTTSDTKGEFLFPFLQPGIYTMRAELLNFATLEQTDIEIHSGQRIIIVLKMKASLHEEVSVVADTPVVDRTSTTTVTKISHQVTELLPLKRSVGDIIKMAPGVVDERIGGANLSISGASGWENTYIIDGVNVTNPGSGGLGVNPLTHFFMPTNGLPLDSILETQVITAGFEPEYGESQGGVINIITKAGGNQVHGSAHFYSTPQAEQTILSGADYEIETGADLGGPILKNKLFFYGAYELTASKTTIFLNPAYPGYSVLPEFQEKSNTNAYSFKISATPSSTQSLELSASGSPTYLPLGIHEGWQIESAVNPRMAESEWHFGNNSQELRWSGGLRSNFFIEAQLGRSYGRFVFNPTPLSDNVPRMWDYTKDGMDIGGFGGDFNFYDTNWQYGVKFTNLWNHHQIRYGFQFEDIDHYEVNHRTGPVFAFPDGSIARNGYVIRKFADDYYMVEGVIPGLDTESTTKYLYSFLQDSWDITSRFNINVGLRWEQQTLKEDQENHRINFGNNWAPRIGASYDYLNNGNSKVFFHYGRFYERLPNYAASYLSTHNNAVAYFFDRNLTQLDYQEPTTLYSYLFGKGPMEFEGHENSDSPFVAKLAYSNEWSGGIEQEIQPGFSLRVNVIFRKLARALDTVGLDPSQPCQPVSANTCYPPPITIENWLLGSNAIYLFTNIDGHIAGVPPLERNYASVQFSAEKRFSDRFQILGSYTYARLTGNYAGDDQGGAADLAVSSLAPFNSTIGPLANDIRHAVKLFGNYKLQNLNTGVAFYFQTGRPITRLIEVQREDEFSNILLQEPRGASGRTDSITNIDLHADYTLPGFHDQKFSIGADVFNVFNFQGVTAVDEVELKYKPFNPVPLPNPTFLKPSDIQQPRTIRVLFRYTF